MFDLSYVSLSVLLVVQSVCCNSPTVRQTANGPVEGIELVSSLGQKYYAFKGVPYAEPPITGNDPYTDEKIDRRFKVWNNYFNLNSSVMLVHILFVDRRLSRSNGIGQTI